MLRKQAKAVLAALDELAAAAARGDTTPVLSEAIGQSDVAALTRRHSLDCTIKLGWAAEAVAMYRRLSCNEVVNVTSYGESRQTA